MTELTVFQKDFLGSLPHIRHSLFEPMREHTSFRIGGPAEVMAFPETDEALAQLLLFCSERKVTPAILGAGTNVLAPDKGISGLVICLKDCMDGMAADGEDGIVVSAGVTMTRAAVFAAKLGLSGLEFAHGIPGTVGGGVYMNAGAYGGELSQVCDWVDVMTVDGEICRMSKEKMGFSYRHSVLEEQPGIVLRARFGLKKDNEEEIRARMKDLMNRRSASQPLDKPSAGSAFKRPVGGYAAALIDRAGLKGFAVGDAAISEKHAGFAVNLGNATAKDVLELLRQVSDRVYADSGIRLEPEVRIW